MSEEPAAEVAPVLELRHVTKRFELRHRLFGRGHEYIHAVDDVNLSVQRGTTCGLVGETGSGKSTVARIAVRLTNPTSGSVLHDGVDISALSRASLRSLRKGIQIVFQDPYSSLDPLATVADSVVEPLTVHTNLSRQARRARVNELFDLVGLRTELVDRRPSELSGGQLQRVAIARALALEPRLLVLDEPVSALDVSTQAQVINLLIDLQTALGVAYLFIAHDLAVVRQASDRIAVMYLGKIMEEGPADELYKRPTHPYTAALISAIPLPHPGRQRARRRLALGGDTASPVDPVSGCRFASRCPFRMEVCLHVDPPAVPTNAGGTTYCHLHQTGPTLNGAPLPASTESVESGGTISLDDMSTGT